MGNKMLIDAAHPEETRVVVVRNNNRIEELDYEAAARKQLRGNIYLAKVTRVEPSLQAAFVDYGGNRHGFLAFNEIHPDYYQIPVADRQALLEQEAADDRAENEADDGDAPAEKKPRRRSRRASKAEAAQLDETIESAPSEETQDEQFAAPETSDEESEEDDQDNGGDEQVESVGTGDAMEEVPVRKGPRRRSYNIQEVIKRRQIILVQVVKEERGNKGAALTTYLSLAGRYCVLMPNTARGGGISRKITDAQDRKRLKDVAKSANVPDGMGLIVRTAGANRTKAEVKRDFDYLLRLWENVRDLTLESTAPCLVYEEGSLIKRAIRDLYTKDIDSIEVEGEEGYKEAKEFMRMLMPSHARNVKSYKDVQPLFMRHSIDSQLDVLFNPQVTLPSGGYLVINQTEALVAIDVNSGKATKEHSIEDTALKTNLEAAEEVSRQMRLRDLAGLIVIDFIDMEERRNNRSVERRLKDRLKSDRARIQVGRISHFGLLEMSRQRMRSGVLESSTRSCPACEGRGFVRSVESASLQVLRGLEEHLQRGDKENLVLKAPRDVALYILNQKRDHLLQIQTASEVSIFVESDDDLLSSEFSIERSGGGPVKPARGRAAESNSAEGAVRVDSPFAGSSDGEGEEDGEGRSKKRRRRRGRRGSRQNRRDDDLIAANDDADADGEDAPNALVASQEDDEDNSERPQERKSRRGSRGGRRRRSRNSRPDSEDLQAAGPQTGDAQTEDAQAEEAQPEEAQPAEPEAEKAQADAASDTAAPDSEDVQEKKPRKRRARKANSVDADEAKEDAAPKPKRRSRAKPKPDDTAEDAGTAASSLAAEPEQAGGDGNGSDVSGNGISPDAENVGEAASPEPAPHSGIAADDPEPVINTPPVEPEAPASPPRRGWWQRR